MIGFPTDMHSSKLVIEATLVDIDGIDMILPQPRSINFSTESGLTHAGRLLPDFRIICNPSAQVTFSGFMPSEICFRGGGKYAIAPVFSDSNTGIIPTDRIRDINTKIGRFFTQ